MENFIKSIARILYDGFVGIFVITTVGFLLHFLQKKEIPVFTDGSPQDAGSSPVERPKESRKTSRNESIQSCREINYPTENEDSLQEAMHRLQKDHRAKVSSLEENIRTRHEQEDIVRELERCLTLLTETPNRHAMKISVEAVLNSDTLQRNGEMHLTREQIQIITESVLQNEHLNRTVLNNVTNIVHAVLQERGQGVDPDIERMIQEHTTQLDRVIRVLQRLEDCQYSQQQQSETVDEHMQILHQRNLTLHYHVQEMQRHLQSLEEAQPLENDGLEKTQNKLKELLENMKHETQRSNEKEVQAIRDSTRRNCETLTHITERVKILEDWLKRTVHTSQECAKLNERYNAQKAVIDILDERLREAEKGVSRLVRDNIEYRVIQGQVDTISESVLRITDQLNQLLNNNVQ